MVKERLCLFSKLLFLVLANFSIWGNDVSAQAPLQFNYQAVARDGRGVPMTGQNISIRLSILNESDDGKVEYSETRKLQTNQFGMFSVSVGSSGAFFTTGTLKDVEWGSGKKFLRAEIDPNGNNQFTDLGSTQLVSVPYALFALQTLGGSLTDGEFAGMAGNGLSVRDSVVMLGNAFGNEDSRLIENRYLPLNGHSLIFKDGTSELRFSKEGVSIQVDSTLVEEGSRSSGAVFLKVDPIFPRPDALPFLFSRSATQQHGGTTSPNEVVLWGHNISGGGGPYISGLPGIGYSIESNFRPEPDSRWLESHEFYITPQGQQIRLKSYTIKTASNHVDFYQSVDNFYLKNPRSGGEYFGITGNDENSIQSLYLGNLKILSNKEFNQILFSTFEPNGELYFNQNWKNVFLPGMLLQSNGQMVISSHISLSEDDKLTFGDRLNRLRSISSKNYYGNKMILKENWQPNEDIQPTSTIDIENINGFNQFRLRKTYTPSGSADANGNTGDMAWDANYIYIKTASGWKRAGLQSF